MTQWVLFVIFISLLGASQNLFVVTDKSGKKVVKRLHHKPNACLEQSSSDYSMRAFFDTLKRIEKEALEYAKLAQKANQIKQMQQEARRKSKRYRLSDKEKEILLAGAKRFLGGKYVWGGSTPEGFDCSGFVHYLYKKRGIRLPRRAYEQSMVGKEIERSELKRGDLLFFLTDKSRGLPITHVGIYLGNDRFIHAASKKKGIIISPLSKGYYADTFVKATRITR